MQSIVINRCYGGFGLSYAGVMDYARRLGIKVYAYQSARKTDGHLDFKRFVPWDGKTECFSPIYSTVEAKDGDFPDGAIFSRSDIKRDDPHLVATVKALKAKANGDYAKLTIVQIPDDVTWDIDDYDGM